MTLIPKPSLPQHLLLGKPKLQQLLTEEYASGPTGQTAVLLSPHRRTSKLNLYPCLNCSLPALISLCSPPFTDVQRANDSFLLPQFSVALTQKLYFPGNLLSEMSAVYDIDSCVQSALYNCVLILLLCTAAIPTICLFPSGSPRHLDDGSLCPGEDIAISQFTLRHRF